MKLYADHEELRQPDVTQFELEEWIDSSPFEILLGMQIERAADGQALLSMPFTVKLANGGGVMHGGAMTTRLMPLLPWQSKVFCRQVQLLPRPTCPWNLLHRCLPDK